MKIQQLVVTHRQVGMAVDPKRSGFTVAACSPDLDDKARQALETVCSSLGQTVQGSVPAATAQALNAWWQAQSDVDARVPEDVLRDCPVLWSYSRLRDELYAMVRVSYLGLTDDRPTRRTGNFLAHALVFAPDALAACNYNPMALARCAGLFLTTDDGRQTALPARDDLPTAPAGANGPLVAQPPYAAKLSELAWSLCNGCASGKSLVLCLEDWRRAPALVESILTLLPPGARCRTTFTTFHVGALPAPVQGQRSTPINLPDLGVCCGRDNISKLGMNDLKYRGDDYVVLNYLDSKYTAVPASVGYAALAAGALRDGRGDGLAAHHSWTVTLGLAADRAARDAWEKLLPVAEFKRLDDPAPAVRSAMDAIVDVARQPAQALAVLSRLRPQIAELASQDCLAPLEVVVAHLANLLTRASPDSKTALPQPIVEYMTELSTLAQSAMDRGRARTADVLLRAFGGGRDDVLLSVVSHWIGAIGASAPAAASMEDQRVLAQLLPQTARLPATRSSTNLSFGRLLVESMRAANRAGCADQVWNDIGELAKSSVQAAPEPTKRQMLEDLLAALPATGCSNARLWLGLTHLEVSRLQGEQLLGALENTATGLAGPTADPAAVEMVLAAVNRLLTDGLQRAEALGRMYARVRDAGPARDALWQAYAESKDKLDPSALRRRLATAGAIAVLVDELFQQTVPWAEPESSQALDVWMNDVVRGDSRTMDAVRSRVAAQLEPNALSLAARLVDTLPGEKPPLPGRTALCAAGIRLLAIAPPDRPRKERAKFLTDPPQDLPDDARARLRVIELLARINEQASRPDWSVRMFPQTDPAWRDVGQLRPADQTRTIDWCIQTFSATGITSPQDADALSQMMIAARIPDPDGAVVDAIRALLTSRDPVTSVNVAMAFGRKVLQAPEREFAWREAFRTVVGMLDRRARDLLEQHLEGRFCQHTREYNAAVRRLCDAADLRAPRIEEPPIPIPPRQQGLRQAEEPGMLTRFLRWITGGGPKAPPQPDTRPKARAVPPPKSTNGRIGATSPRPAGGTAQPTPQSKNKPRGKQ